MTTQTPQNSGASENPERQSTPDTLAIADKAHRMSAKADERAAAREAEELEEDPGFAGLDEDDALDLLLSAEPAEQLQDVVLPPRKGTDKDLKLTLRSVTESEWDEIRNQSEKTKPAANRQQRRARRGNDEPEMDNALMARLLVKKATVNLNWNDSALRQKFKAQTGEDVIKAVLLYGEVANLAQIVMEISGFEEDLIQLVGEG